MRSVIVFGFVLLFAATSNAATPKATAKAAAAAARAAKAAAAQPKVTAENIEAIKADDASNGEFQPKGLEALPEKNIEEGDLNAEADKVIRDAAARLSATESAKVNVATVAASAVATTAAKIVATKAVNETDIPVLTNFGPKKEAIANPWARLTLSFIVLGALAGGLLLFSRWYSKRNQLSGDTNKIKVLTQHFLGPKKSLAIVRVAGETILIGVTDQNISMIKSLALLDEDIPEATPNNFNQTMASADAKPAVVQRPSKGSDVNYEPLEDFVVSNIKDKVFTKLKNLRPL